MVPKGGSPRILLITRNLPPLEGGMEKLMQHMAYVVNEYAELTVTGSLHCSQHLADDIEVIETSAKLIPFLLGSTRLAISVCRQNRFDIIIGGSGLIAPTLRLLTLLFRTRTIIFLHGLDLVVDNTFYQKLFVPCIRNVSKVVTNSQNTRRIAVEKGIPKNRIAVIHPGTNLPKLPDSAALVTFRNKYNMNFDKTMLLVGRMTRRKGLSRSIDDSLPSTLATEPHAGLVIVGDNPRDSLNKLGEQKGVLTQVERLQDKRKVVFLGQISDSELEACYSAADVHIFPLVNIPGDVEGFGMVAIEAAACGTPKVCFDTGGVADAVDTENGALVPEGNYDGFSDSVLAIIRSGIPTAQACIDHARQFSWCRYHRKVEDVIREQMAEISL